MGREYTISTGIKIFYILLAAGMFVFAGVLLKMPQSQPILWLFPLAIITGAVLIIVNAIKRKLIIYNDSILCINLFSRKEIAIADIKGCRIGQKVITIEPVTENSPKIVIRNYIDFSDSDELAKWFTNNFKDLDAIDLEQNKEDFLHDPSQGYTVEDREKKLKIAKRVAITYNIIGVATFGLVFLGKSYPIVITGLFYPLLGIVILKLSKGMIKFIGNSKRSIIPFLFLGFMVPIIIMLIVAISDYQIFQFDALWLPVMFITLIVCVLLYFTGLNQSIGGIKGQVFTMIFMSAIYGFGCVINTNCTFDQSAPTIYKAEVLNHRIQSGKHTSYLLTLTEWGPMHEQKEEDVGRRLYNMVSIGDTVEIYFKPGLLKIPWYHVTK